jgi:hypothetical protein
MADEAVRQGRVTIQDASDYFAWASCTQGAVKYVFVSKEQCEETQNAMKAACMAKFVRNIDKGFMTYFVFIIGVSEVSNHGVQSHHNWVPVSTLDFGNVRTRIVFSEIHLYNYFCSS